MSEWLQKKLYLKSIIYRHPPLPDEIEARLRYTLQHCATIILANALIRTQQLQKDYEQKTINRVEVANKILQDNNPFAGLKLVSEMNSVISSERIVEENYIIQKVSHQLLLDAMDLNNKIHPLYRWTLETWRDIEVKNFQFSDFFNSKFKLEKNNIFSGNLFSKSLGSLSVGIKDFLEVYEIVTRAFILTEKAFETGTIGKDVLDTLIRMIDECASVQGCKEEDLARLAEEILSK